MDISTMYHLLPRTFFNRDTVIVARELLGKMLIRVLPEGTIKVLIAETEAYRSDDPASHAFKRRTARNEPLFGPVGHTYVYFCHGLHHCFNIVARDTQHFPAGGVLIRGAIVLSGQELIKKHYTLKSDLIEGPGNLAKALAIDMSNRNTDVIDPHADILVARGIELTEAQVAISKRIGISQAKDKPWRFDIVRDDAIIQKAKKILKIK